MSELAKLVPTVIEQSNNFNIRKRSYLGFLEILMG